ncbi:MAG: ribonuclease D, partial [Planctomycetes bacterium]|nr:ribonuclease D [Planctomycetota bacterium]
LHHAREDVRILTRLMERPLGRVFDTQLAMSFLDARPQIGYKALVAEVCGARLNKGPQMFDWSRRPLPPDVLRYAIDDVKYLMTIRDQLVDQLKEAGRWEWYEEEQRTALLDMEPSDTTEA